MTLPAFRIEDFEIIPFESHTRPHLKCCPITFPHMARWQSRFYSESFTINLLHNSVILDERLQPIWRRRIRWNLAFLFGLYHKDLHSAAHEIHDVFSLSTDFLADITRWLSLWFVHWPRKSSPQLRILNFGTNFPVRSGHAQIAPCLKPN